MDPTNLYLGINWADQHLNGNPSSPQPPTSVQQIQYAPQQQRTANFTGSLSTGSTPYQPPSATQQTAQPTSVAGQSTTAAALAFFGLPHNGTTPAAQISNGTNGQAMSTTPYSPHLYLPYAYHRPSSALPLSQYSSLSGATGNAGQSSSAPPTAPATPTLPLINASPRPSSSTPQSSLHGMAQTSQPQASTSSQMTIDPSLVGGNYFRSPYGSVPSNGINTPQPYAMTNPYQFLQSPTVISPALLTRSPHGHSNALANRPISIPTIAAPSAMSPPNAVASSSSTPPAAVPIVSGGLASIYKDVLTSKNLDKIPEQTAESIIGLLAKSSWNEIDCPTRVDILTKIRDHAGSGFYKVWAKSPVAMDVLRDWLKATMMREGLEDTLMPVLFVIERLPLGVEELGSSKIAKVVVKAAKEAPSAAVKDLASSIEAKWRNLVKEAGSTASAVKSEDAKKRKIEPPSAKSVPAAKKAAVGSASSSKPTATIVKKIIQTPKDTKADSSFFSSKPKAKLPSFRKTSTPTTIKKESSETAVAQPSSVDPFQEALKSMGRSVGSPAASVEAAAAAIANSIREATPSVVSVSIGKNGRPKKKVTFPLDDKLVQIKIIERAVYDDDGSGEGAHHSSYRDLDIDEGHALHALMFEEQIDWTEPIPIEFPEDVWSNLERGTESTEKQAQEQRENSALMAVYMSTAHIPETPSDLHAGMDGMQPDESETVIMLPGEQIANLEAPPILPTTSLQDILAKLSGNNLSGVPGFDPSNPNTGFGNYPDQQQQQYGEDSEMTWNGYNGNNQQQQQQQQQPSVSWNGEGLPPPTGNGFGDGWDADGPVGRRGSAGVGGGRGGPPWQPRSNNGPPTRFPCRFFNSPSGCHNGSTCRFSHNQS